MIDDYKTGQAVKVQWKHGEWLLATVLRVYENGLDAVVGSKGCHYFQFVDVRPEP